MSHEYYRQKDFFWGALVGGTVATLTALLFTTKKGKQIQHKVGEAYQEVEDHVKEAFSDAKEKASDLKEKAEETVDNVGKKIAGKVKSDH